MLSMFKVRNSEENLLFPENMFCFVGGFISPLPFAHNISISLFFFSSLLLVVDRNFISRMDEKEMPVVSVDLFTFSQDGQFLITVDSRLELNGNRLSCLKFWQREPGTSKHTLTTIVDPPHAVQIGSLVAGIDIAVTAAGPQFKVWMRGDEGQWSCTMVGSLHGARCKRVALSRDNSLLAAAFNNVSVCVYRVR
jgi:hypothetical protein